MIRIHISENANTPLVFKRELLKKNKGLCAFVASKSNLDLLGVGGEVFKTRCGWQVEINSRFLLKNLLPLSIIVSLADHLEIILIYKRLQF